MTRGWLGDQNNGGGDPDDSDREGSDQTPAPVRPGRLVIVGESNPYHQDPRFALYHLPRQASGNRLRKHLGLTDATYWSLAKVNLCSGKWNLAEARATAEGIIKLYDSAILLGAKVRKAFDGPEPFSVAVRAGCYLVGLPHPSGLNRAWSAPGARARARYVLETAIPWTPWGETGA